MNVFELQLPSGKPAGVYCCGVCGSVCGASTELAESCCKCRVCGEECRRDSKDDFNRCHKDCWNQQYAERVAKRLEDAELVEKYEGFVYIDGVGPQDGYFESAEYAEEYIYDQSEEGDELPEFAFCCTEQAPPRLHADTWLEQFEDNGYEGISESCEGVEELEKALDAFWEKNKGLTSWSVDYSRKVRLVYPAEAAGKEAGS